MKKLLSILLSVCLLAGLCACSSSEETIVGAWLAEDGGSVLGLGVTEPSSFDVYYIFNDDGTGQMLNIFPEEYSARNMATEFTYLIGDENAFVMDVGSAHSEGTYEIDGDTLYLDTSRMGNVSLIRVALEEVPVIE